MLRLEQGPASSMVTMLTGTSSSAWGQVPLPLDLSMLGAGPGCWLRHSVDLSLTTTTDGQGRATSGFRVPETLALVGTRLYHTWLVTDPTANALGITSSNAYAVVVGL